MARFSFRVSGSTNQPNVEKLDLADIGEAWTEAARACADMLADCTEGLQPGSHWEMQVLDDADRVLGVFRFSAEAFAELPFTEPDRESASPDPKYPHRL